MVGRQKTHGIGWLFVFVLLGWAIAGGAATREVRAGDLTKLDASLKWIPADAAFYSVLLRNREQFEIIRDSKAWARLMALPAVQEGLKKLNDSKETPDSPAAKLQAGLENPAIREALALLGDMLSRDVFVAGSPSVVDFLELMQKVNQAQQTAQMLAMIAKEKGSEELEEGQLQGRAVIHVLANNPSLIRVPELIAGFRVEKTDRAKEQLDTLMGLLTLAGMSVPELQDYCKRTTVCGSEYITITLKGEQIPWDKVPLDKAREIEKGEVDKVVEKLKQLTLVIAIGLRGDTLLVSVGESTEQLARLGTAKLLVDRPELKPLEKFADKRLTSISYSSKDLAARLGTSKEDVDELLKMVDVLLAQADLPEAEEAQVRKDACALAADLKKVLPTPGAALAFSFLTDDGMESYSYNWGQGHGLEGGKPLSLLKHVGGSPLLASVARGKNAAEGYQLLSKWLKIGARYFDKYAVPQMKAKERKEYEKVAKRLRPLARRTDEVTREKLLPSVGKEGGVVLEAELKLKQIAKDAPAADKPIPIPELALVVELKDESLFCQAMEAYREIINDLVDELHELKPEGVPDIEISEAQEESTESGTIYSCPLPKEAGVNAQLAPSLGLAQKAAVFSLSRPQVARLLKPTPLAVGGALANSRQPRAAAFVLQWAKLVEKATPWVELVTAKALDDKCIKGEKAKEIKQQVCTVLDLLQVLRTVTASTSFEDGALVNHNVAVVRDVK